MKLTILLAGAILAAGLVAADGVHALEIVQSQTFAKGADAGYSERAVMDAVASVALDPFDPTLGTLDAVHVRFKATVQGEAVGEHWDVPESLDLVPHVESNLEYAWRLVYDLPHFDPPMASLIETRWDGCEDTADFVFANASCETAITLDETFVGVSELVDSVDLAAYVGTDPLAAEFTAKGVVTRYTTTDDPQYGDGSSWLGVEGLFEVTYDYTPAAVPEPTTSVLLAAGLAGLGAARRSRSRGGRTRR